MRFRGGLLRQIQTPFTYHNHFNSNLKSNKGAMNKKTLEDVLRKALGFSYDNTPNGS